MVYCNNLVALLLSFTSALVQCIVNFTSSADLLELQALSLCVGLQHAQLRDSSGTPNVYSGNFWKTDCANHYAASNDSFWIEHFRMNLDSFDELVEIVEPHLNPKRGPKPDAQLLVAVALSYLSHGATYTQLQKDFGTPRGTSYRYLTRFVDILVDQRRAKAVREGYVQYAQEHCTRWKRTHAATRSVARVHRVPTRLPHLGGADLEEDDMWE